MADQQGALGSRDKLRLRAARSAKRSDVAWLALVVFMCAAFLGVMAYLLGVAA